MLNAVTRSNRVSVFSMAHNVTLFHPTFHRIGIPARSARDLEVGGSGLGCEAVKSIQRSREYFEDSHAQLRHLATLPFCSRLCECQNAVYEGLMFHVRVRKRVKEGGARKNCRVQSSHMCFVQARVPSVRRIQEHVMPLLHAFL